MFSRRAAAPRKLAPGDEIGGYLIDSELGEGAMGTVYRARSAAGGGDVALKVVKAELAGSDDHVRRFRREARAAAAVEHPHLVAVLDEGEEDGRLYLAMRYVPGRSLADRVCADGPLDPAE